MSFSLYAGKRRIRSFRDQPLTSMRYDSVNRNYTISLDTVQIYFPKLNVADVALKVNKDKYRVTPEKRKYEFIYLNKASETLVVDFSIIDSKGNLLQFKNQQIASLPFNSDKGCYIVDREYIKLLRKQQSTAKL